MNNLKFITVPNVIGNMLNDTQVNRLTEAMYLVHGMLKQAYDLHNQTAIGSALSDSANYMKRAQDQKGFKKIETNGIKSLPREPKYKDAISILQQHADRPGVKELLEDVYKEYPELKPKLLAIAGQPLT